MLARLNEIAGIQSSSASVGNPEGTLVRVSLHPGANTAKIMAEVQRVLSEAVRDGSPTPLTQPAAAAALQQKEWLDPQQLADLATTDLATPAGRGPVLLVALLVGAMVVLLGLFGWRHLRHRQTGSSQPGPGLSLTP